MSIDPSRLVPDAPSIPAGPTASRYVIGIQDFNDAPANQVSLFVPSASSVCVDNRYSHTVLVELVFQGVQVHSQIVDANHRETFTILTSYVDTVVLTDLVKNPLYLARTQFQAILGSDRVPEQAPSALVGTTTIPANGQVVVTATNILLFTDLKQRLSPARPNTVVSTDLSGAGTATLRYSDVPSTLSTTFNPSYFAGFVCVNNGTAGDATIVAAPPGQALIAPANSCSFIVPFGTTLALPVEASSFKITNPGPGRVTFWAYLSAEYPYIPGVGSSG